MTEAFNHEPILPQVDTDDIAQIMFEDITDPTHKKRWDHFVETNPALAQVVLDKAYHAVNEEDTNIDLTRRLINTITFAVAAIEVALMRRNAEQSSDGRDGEVLPPLV